MLQPLPVTSLDLVLFLYYIREFLISGQIESFYTLTLSFYTTRIVAIGYLKYTNDTSKGNAANSTRFFLGKTIQDSTWHMITSAVYSTATTFTGICGLVMLLVVFGLPLFDQVEATWLASCFVGSLVILPASNILGINEAAWTRFLTLKPETPEEKELLHTLFACLGGMWVGGLATPLDWNQAWQIWPAPTFIGSFVGYSIATLSTLSTLKV
ncbi:hypothetical protein SmJEL517_g00790 [Synchytrium microbalum]|uniref:Glycosylphosphatidylinositol anchor biosynthesis protein 11 n=1 Tax=Synchytrium microbalum TaxID=1806994 RepID=A0A507CHK9_9FUNG|nr:uncharacterized protein SmJEL517_g00790 [Synchytrium microbalum]TPX37175.1 hypothetical protein SmJEL517_g00790 [Synchytrium microbalum]